MDLRVAQIVPCTEAEGPGRRFAVWVQGCPLRCSGCCNPEMFPHDGGVLVAPRELARRAIETLGIEGISLLGGEPFAQAAGCATFARAVRQAGLSVMVFTGYTLAELRAGEEAGGAGELLAASDLLVDGRFEKEQLDPSRRWIGSRNQVLHFLSARYSPTDPRFSTSNTAELRLTGKELTMNGWPGLVPDLRRRARGTA
jgi:anaerobic ribonucleoside-triphosphate reductase activating protein